jgi:ectoine hydroxylase-related dioxygenase (phytanoyl-CoA dioxygenase family)
VPDVEIFGEFVVTAEQVSHYHREGYTVVQDFLESQEVSDLIQEIARICKGNTLAHHDATRLEMEPQQDSEGTLVRRIYEPCTHYPLFRSLSEASRLLDCVQKLLGPHLIFHYSKINMKPPAIGSVVEWHQDLAYYPLTNTDSLAALFYLDDADRGNGCLQVIPGQNQGPLMNHTRDGLFQGRVTEPVDESKAIALEGKAGTVIFMNGMTPHASVTNTSQRPRRTLIVSYRAADAFPVYFGETTLRAETYVRQVRGEPAPFARCSRTEIPIPRQLKKTASLYELQDLSRKNLGSIALRVLRNS